MTTAPADTFRQPEPGSPSPTATTGTVPALDGRLRDLLAGQKIVLTGVTGFIGE